MYSSILHKMVSVSMLINSDNIKRLIYVGLAAFFVTRVYRAEQKSAGLPVLVCYQMFRLNI